MLDFFRKYQKYFFYVITFVVVISFSFFGTFNAVNTISAGDQPVFTAVDGSTVKRGDVEDLVLFLNSDMEDKILLGGSWGPNFLNDGVVKKDFLETGLAQLIVAQYASDLGIDLQSRLEKEKRYPLYSHPRAKFISVENAWSYFAPEIKENLDVIKVAHDPLEPNALDARVNLYLAEKKFPPQLLRQVLSSQEQRYEWIGHDPNLDRTDFSLFGYHTLDDWFGSRFVRLVAQFIINSAKIAEERGYSVTKDEVLADLLRNSAISYQQNKQNHNIGVANQQEYFNEQLRRMGMDQNKAVKVWKQVLLFKRLFHDQGNSVFVDPFAYANLARYAKETLQVDAYRMPQNLRIGDYKTMQKFDIYLAAIRQGDGKEPLRMPANFKTAQEVSKKFPELVQKRYLLELSQIDLNSVKARIGLKEMWNWQVEDKNWDRLKKQFPDLGVKKGDTREERFAALDSLDEMTRNRVDSYSRTEIVKEHPDWITKALAEAPMEKKEVGIALKGSSTHFKNLDRPENLMALLDKAPLGEVSDELSLFTTDNQNYFRIRVLDRSPDLEIMIFAEANRQGAMDKILDKTLSAYYETIRETTPKIFQLNEKTWKPYVDAKTDVADRFFADQLDALRTIYAKENGDERLASQVTGEQLAPYRFYVHMNDLKQKIQRSPDHAENYLQAAPSLFRTEEKLADVRPLDKQWLLEKTDLQVTREADNPFIDKHEAFSLKEKAWSKISVPPNGDLNFYQVKNRIEGDDRPTLVEEVNKVYTVLGNEVKRALGAQLLALMKQKDAISLKYMNRSNVEEIAPEEE